MPPSGPRLVGRGVRVTWSPPARPGPTWAYPGPPPRGATGSPKCDAGRIPACTPALSYPPSRLARLRPRRHRGRAVGYAGAHRSEPPSRSVTVCGRCRSRVWVALSSTSSAFRSARISCSRTSMAAASSCPSSKTAFITVTIRPGRAAFPAKTSAPGSRRCSCSPSSLPIPARAETVFEIHVARRRQMLDEPTAHDTLATQVLRAVAECLPGGPYRSLGARRAAGRLARAEGQGEGRGRVLARVEPAWGAFPAPHV